MKTASGLTGAVGLVAVTLLLALLGGFVALVAMTPGGVSQEQTASTASSGATSCLDPELVGSEQIPSEYQDNLASAAESSGVDVNILAAQIEAESDWNPDAESHVGAQGLTQFMPSTWDEWGEGDPYNPDDAIAAQGRYMGHLRSQIADVASGHDEEIRLMLAAYNAGPGAVQDANGIPPYQETQNYVRDITRLAEKYASASSGDSEDQIQRAAHVELAAQTPDASPSNCGDVQTVMAGLTDGDWAHPLPGGQRTSGFGSRPCPSGTDCNEFVTKHQGLDFSAGGGASVVAPTQMEITATGSNQYQGTYVVARQVKDDADPDSLPIFEFHHCQAGSAAEVGDTLDPGDQVCLEGNTGNSSGAHLHFQINAPGADPNKPTYTHAVDPEPILQKMGAL